MQILTKGKRVTMLSDKVDFSRKEIDRTLYNDKQSMHMKTTILNVYTPNNSVQNT